MSTDLAASVRQLVDAADALRRRVNRRRRHHALMRRQRTWNTLCSAMDVIGDTCSALWAYDAAPPITDHHDKGAAYLLAYGILHTLYLQQDAVFWWCKSLRLDPVATFDEPGDWARSISELSAARSARNDSIGHPVRRAQPKTSPIAAFFIVQHSITSHGFQLIKHEEGKITSEWTYVSFRSLIAGQVQALTTVLKTSCDLLDAQDDEHHKAFMHKPLTPLIDALSYPLEKLGSKRNVSDWELVPGCIREVRRGLDELRRALDERSEPFGDSWLYRYRRLSTALKWLLDYGSRAQTDADDDMAEVVAEYVRWAIDDLRDLTNELDAEYRSRYDK